MTARASVAELPDEHADDRLARPRRPLHEYVEASGMSRLVIGASKDPNAKVTTLLVSPASGRPALAIKAPTTEAAERAVDAEARLLTALADVGGAALRGTVPRVVDMVDFDGRRAAVMTAVSGVPMTTAYMRPRHTASRARVAGDFDAVARWLASFQGATASVPGPIEMDADVTARLAERFAGDERVGDDLVRLGEIHGRLRASVVPRTAVQGDLWMGNVLLTDRDVSGVVDWEAGTAVGEPVRDLVRFAHIYALYLDRRTRPGRAVRGHRGLRAGRWGVGVEYALTGRGWFPELFRRFIGDGLVRLGAPAAMWRDAALAGIAEVAALTDEPKFAGLHLDLFRRMATVRARRQSSP